MKRFLILLALVTTPALAHEESKPLTWNIIIQLKATAWIVSYPTEEKCREAVKLISPHLKKLGRADCVPLLQP